MKYLEKKNKVMTEYEFVYDEVGRKVRVIATCGSGYIYAGTEKPVEIGTVVHSGVPISFEEFVNWCTKPRNFLLEDMDDRVVKIYENKGEFSIICCDGFGDEHYLPWDEFKEYDSVFIAGGNTFVLINDITHEKIEFFALGLNHIDIK